MDAPADIKLLFAPPLAYPQRNYHFAMLTFGYTAGKIKRPFAIDLSLFCLLLGTLYHKYFQKAIGKLKIFLLGDKKVSDQKKISQKCCF